MAFDLASAQPVAPPAASGKFDLASAQPVTPTRKVNPVMDRGTDLAAMIGSHILANGIGGAAHTFNRAFGGTGETPNLDAFLTAHTHDLSNPENMSDADKLRTAVAPITGAISNVAGKADTAIQHAAGDSAVGDIYRSAKAEAPDAANMMGLVAPAEGALSVGGDMADAASAARAAARESQGIAPDSAHELAQRAGYRVRPSAVINNTGGEATRTSQALEAVGGSEQIRGDNLRANKVSTNNIARGDVGLPSGSTIEPEELDKAEAPAAAIYQHMRETMPQKTGLDPSTVGAIRDAGLADLLPGQKLPSTFLDTQNALLAIPHNAGDLIDNISRLRAQGFRRITPDVPGGQVDPDIAAHGSAQLDMAKALENELNVRTQAADPSGSMTQAYQQARKLFAKTGTIRRALVGGDVDPQALSTAAAKTDAIDGGLRVISDAAQAFPHDISLNIPESASAVHPVKEALGGAATGVIAGHAAGGVPGAIVGGLAGLSTPALRLAARRMLGANGAAADSSALGLKSPIAEHFSPVAMDSAGAPTASSMADNGELSLAADQPARSVPAGTGEDQIPLHELLSHGVEQGPEQGMSLEPSAPRQQPGSGDAGPMHPAIADFLSHGMDVAPDLPLRAHAHAAIAAQHADLGDVLAGHLGVAEQQRLPPGMSLGDQPGATAPKPTTASGMQIHEDVHGAVIPDSHVMPGSTVLTRGDPDKAKSYIALTPAEDGKSMSITGAKVRPELQGSGLGKSQLLDAVQYAADKGVALNSDTAVSAAQLRVYDSLERAGKIEFDVADPDQYAKALQTKGNTFSYKAKGGGPMITNIRMKAPEEMTAGTPEKPTPQMDHNAEGAPLADVLLARHPNMGTSVKYPGRRAAPSLADELSGNLSLAQ